MDSEITVVRHVADDEKEKYVATLKGETLVDGEVIQVELKFTSKASHLITAWPLGSISSIKVGPTPQQKMRQT
jgi:hypothetical protein